MKHTKKIINLGHKEQIPLGQGMCFTVNKKSIAVFRPRQGDIVAMQYVCPHKKGPLADGMIEDGHIVCPLHEHRFCMKTGQGNIDGEYVKIFEAWTDNTYVFVKM